MSQKIEIANAGTRRGMQPNFLDASSVSNGTNGSSRSSEHEFTDAQSARSSGAESGSLMQFSPEVHAHLQGLVSKARSPLLVPGHDAKTEDGTSGANLHLQRTAMKSRVQGHGEALMVEARPHSRGPARGVGAKRPLQEMARDAKPGSMAGAGDSFRTAPSVGNGVFAGDDEAREEALAQLRAKLANMPVQRKGGVALLHFDDILEMLEAHGVDVATLDADTVHHLQTIVNNAASEIVLDICAQKKQRIATSKHLSISAPDVQEAVSSLAMGPEGGARNATTATFYSYIERCDVKLGALDPLSKDVRDSIVARRENPVGRGKKKRKGAAAAGNAASSSSSSSSSAAAVRPGAAALPSAKSAQVMDSSISDASMLIDFANTANGQAPAGPAFASANAVHPGFIESRAGVNSAFENPDFS